MVNWEKVIELENQIEKFRKLEEEEGVDVGDVIDILQKKIETIYQNLSSWDRTKLARHPQRPCFKDYIPHLFSYFEELAGDRKFRNDPAIITGIANFCKHKVFVIGQEKGRETSDKIQHNFGMAHPEGYWKTQRIMKLAEKFGYPLLLFIDTPGAYPGIGAEERGQFIAIAENLALLSDLKVPIIVTILGEGGSGGALALGIGDRILMLENAIYSVISPEGCAAILWKNASKAEEAANALKISSYELKKFGIIHDIVPEPIGGAHKDLQKTAENLSNYLKKHLNQVKKLPINKLLEERYQFLRKLGQVEE